MRNFFYLIAVLNLKGREGVPMSNDQTAKEMATDSATLRQITAFGGLFGKLFSAGSRKARQAREDAETDEVKLAIFGEIPAKYGPR